jgi:hypothetical protein
MRLAAVLAAAALAGGLTACGSHSASPATAGATASPAETNPAGDIPDNIAYVAYSPPDGRYTIKVPEGWSRSEAEATVSFTDKLNSVRIEVRPLATAPTDASARAQEVPAGAAGVGVTDVALPAGPAVKATYQQDSAPDPVTGRSRREAVERYSLWNAGTEVALTLAGPVGADNADPYRQITGSFRWRQ